MPLALCPVSLKRTTVRRFFCLDLVSGLCSLCDRCCPTSSRHSVVVKNKRENDTLSLVVDFIAIRGKEELSPFVRSTVLLGPLLCALSSFFLLFLFDGAGHDEKKRRKQNVGIDRGSAVRESRSTELVPLYSFSF